MHNQFIEQSILKDLSKDSFVEDFLKWCINLKRKFKIRYVHISNAQQLKCLGLKI